MRPVLLLDLSQINDVILFGLSQSSNLTKIWDKFLSQTAQKTVKVELCDKSLKSLKALKSLKINYKSQLL